MPKLKIRKSDSTRRMAKSIGCLLFPLVCLGCQIERPDVSLEASAITGVDHAITFRENAEPLSSSTSLEGELTAARVVRLALQHDPRIQSALARVRIAEADANQARLLPNPILNIDVRFPTRPGSNTAFEATLTGDVVAMLQKPAQISAADKRLRESVFDALTTVLDVIAEAQSAYANAAALDGLLANANDRQKILEHLRDLSQKRLEVGDAARLDVTTLDAQVMLATIDLADIRLQRMEQRLNLARMIGQPLADAQWTLSSPEQAAPTAIATEREWIDTALQHRPEISSRLWELKALGDDLSATALAPFLGGDLGAHAEHDPEWRVGPTFTTPLPVFDWGQASRAKVEAQRIAARHDLAQQQLEVIQEVRLAYASYQQSLQTLAASQTKLFPLQHQQLDESQRAYQLGEIDLATLLLAESDFQLGLSKIVTLQQNVELARVKLQRAAGGAAIAGRLETVIGNPTTTPATSQPATGPS